MPFHRILHVQDQGQKFSIRNSLDVGWATPSYIKCEVREDILTSTNSRSRLSFGSLRSHGSLVSTLGFFLKMRVTYSSRWAKAGGTVARFGGSSWGIWYSKGTVRKLTVKLCLIVLESLGSRKCAFISRIQNTFHGLFVDVGLSNTARLRSCWCSIDFTAAQMTDDYGGSSLGQFSWDMESSSLSPRSTSISTCLPRPEYSMFSALATFALVQSSNGSAVVMNTP